MALYGKIMVECIRNQIKPAMILTKGRGDNLALMSKGVCVCLMDKIRAEEAGVAARIIGHFFANAVEINPMEEEILIPPELLAWLDINEDTILYLTESHQPEWGEYVLSKDMTWGTQIPLVIEDIVWKEEDGENE